MEKNIVAPPFSKTHAYAVTLQWIGNTGAGTSGYRTYRRDHCRSRTAEVPGLGQVEQSHASGSPSTWLRICS